MHAHVCQCRFRVHKLYFATGLYGVKANSRWQRDPDSSYLLPFLERVKLSKTRAYLKSGGEIAEEDRASVQEDEEEEQRKYSYSILSK